MDVEELEEDVDPGVLDEQKVGVRVDRVEPQEGPSVSHPPVVSGIEGGWADPGVLRGVRGSPGLPGVGYVDDVTRDSGVGTWDRSRESCPSRSVMGTWGHGVDSWGWELETLRRPWCS